jgi:hypothetical protein
LNAPPRRAAAAAVAVVAALLAAALLVPACSEEAAVPAPPPAPAKDPVPEVAKGPGVKFVDLHGDATGFSPENHTGIAGDKSWIAEAMGGGVIVLDYDRDGRMDVLFVDGNVVDRAPVPGARTRLFRNLGGFRFAETTKEAGIDVTGVGYGGAAADYDGDGDVDVYLCMLGSNVLLKNRGDGTFVDAAGEAGVGGGERDMSTACCWADFDGDGRLDLYVANYMDMLTIIDDFKKLGRPGRDCDWRGFKVYCGPMPPYQKDRLYLSNGPDPKTGVVTFRDATENLRDQAARPSFQPVAADYDQDGDLDVFTATDTLPNHLWVNDGKGVFRDEGMEAGCAYSGTVKAQAGMGVDVSDYDHDGKLDIIVTNFSHDYYTLYRNTSVLPRKGAKGFVPAFDDVSIRTGVSGPTYIRLGWGAHFVDYDGDGDRDLMFTSGHVYGEIDNFAETGTTYRQKNLLLENRGGSSPLYVDVSEQAGPAFQVQEVHRGSAAADFDDDGDLDFAVAVLNGKAYLVRNDGGNGAPWLRITLRGKAPLDPAGALVCVEADGLLPQWEVAKRGDSFVSCSDPRILFGLGTAKKAAKVTVTWPSGGKSEFRDLEAKAHWLLEEGVAEAKRLP